MSVYNGEAFVKSAIESILKQTYKNFEHIVIDGGSTDETLDIIKASKVISVCGVGQYCGHLDYN